jgi:hypothetical protein
MRKGYRLRSMPYLLATLLTAGPYACPARADITYTYIGNAFNQFPDPTVGCPPVCNVTGSFTVAQALAPDLSLAPITPDSFSITSGGVTLMDGVPTETGLQVSTDSSGAISNWDWVVSGPATAPIARILTENVPGFLVADDVRLSSYGALPPPLYGRRVGQVSNDPGTWTTTPEPSGVMLLSTALLSSIAAVRRKRTSPRSTSNPRSRVLAFVWCR